MTAVSRKLIFAKPEFSFENIIWSCVEFILVKGAPRILSFLGTWFVMGTSHQGAVSVDIKERNAHLIGGVAYYKLLSLRNANKNKKD